MVQILSENLTKRNVIVWIFLESSQREKMLHEPKRNDTPLTALVQSIPEQRAFDLYLCYVRCLLV